MTARRPWAWPLVPVYAGMQAAQSRLRAAGLLRTRRLGCPVISVGSISAGGAGKTPVVIALAKLLVSRGWRPDVLSRGYGREDNAVQQVDPDLPDAAAHFGDEPVLMARATGVPVWVGRARFAAGAAAESRSREHSLWPDAPLGALHILDDGFQHRALARDLDIVLLTAADLEDALLPAGNRREPLAALRRADALVLREEEADALTDPIQALLPSTPLPVWTLRRSLRFPGPLGVFGAGLRPLAFCAIARPESFVEMLRAAGCGVIDAVTFRDHARYSEQELAAIVRYAQELRATGLITTAKDAVKLSPAAQRRLTEQVGPVMVVDLEADFVYSSPVVRAIEARLRRAPQADPVAR